MTKQSGWVEFTDGTKSHFKATDAEKAMIIARRVATAKNSRHYGEKRDVGPKPKIKTVRFGNNGRVIFPVDESKINWKHTKDAGCGRHRIKRPLEESVAA